MTRRLWIEEGISETGEGIGRVLGLPTSASAAGKTAHSPATPTAPVLHRIRRQSISSCPCLGALPPEMNEPPATSTN